MPSRLARAIVSRGRASSESAHRKECDEPDDEGDQDVLDDALPALPGSRVMHHDISRGTAASLSILAVATQLEITPRGFSYAGAASGGNRQGGNPPEVAIKRIRRSRLPREARRVLELRAHGPSSTSPVEAMKSVGLVTVSSGSLPWKPMLGLAGPPLAPFPGPVSKIRRPASVPRLAEIE